MAATRFFAAALLALAASQADAQTMAEPMPMGPLLTPPTQPSMIAHPHAQPTADFAPPPLPTQPFRWGWFGAERYEPRAQWHYDYQRTSMRWKYYR